MKAPVTKPTIAIHVPLKFPYFPILYIAIAPKVKAKIPIRGKTSTIRPILWNNAGKLRMIRRAGKLRIPKTIDAKANLLILFLWTDDC